MKAAKGWRQLKNDAKPTPTVEELKEYLNAIFFNRTPPLEARMECTSYVNENGVEMVQVLAPCGILQTTAENWNRHMEEVCKPYITLDSSYFKSNSEPITTTKLTLDHDIEVTITYDNEKES